MPILRAFQAIQKLMLPACARNGSILDTANYQVALDDDIALKAAGRVACAPRPCPQAEAGVRGGNNTNSPLSFAENARLAAVTLDGYPIRRDCVQGYIFVRIRHVPQVVL